MTLLKQAQAVRLKQKGLGPVTAEDEELVTAWLTGEVALTQIMIAKKFRGTTQVYLYISQVLRRMWEGGKLTFRGK